MTDFEGKISINIEGIGTMEISKWKKDKKEEKEKDKTEDNNKLRSKNHVFNL